MAEIQKPVFNPGNPISTDDLNKLATLIENANSVANTSILKATDEFNKRIDKITVVQAGEIAGSTEIPTDKWSSDITITFNPAFTQSPSVNINVEYSTDAYVHIRIKSITTTSCVFNAKAVGKVVKTPTFYWIAAAYITK